jgi:hypothetical protein
MSVFDAVDGSLPTASQCADPEHLLPDGQLHILVFAERQVLAISGRQRMSSVTTVVIPTSDVRRFHGRNRVHSCRKTAWVITAGVDPFRTLGW